MNIKSPKKFKPVKDRVHYGGAVITNEEINALLATINNNGGFNWTVGQKGSEFEKALADYTNHKHVVFTNSGSSALLLGLLALNLPKGSLVALPATTFPTAFSSIIYAGYEPLVVDSKIETFNIDEKELEKAFKKFPQIKAVIAVNIAGNIPNLSAIRKLTKKYSAKLILDNCDGFGGIYDNKPVESLADVAATSFHAAHIITTGEGGAVFTSDSGIANRARQYRDWGREGGDDAPTQLAGLPSDYPKRYSYPVLGFNLKPLELQAAVGLVQLKKLDKFKKIRTRNFKELHKIFSKHPKLFRPVQSEELANPCWFSFPIFIHGVAKSKLVSHFAKNNIETRPIFAGNILSHPIGNKAKSIGACPNSSEVLKKGLFIGLSPRTTPDMIKFVGKTVDEFAKKQ